MQGLEYPLTLSGGNLKVSKDYPQIVKQAILSGLYTQLTERVFRPEYGLDPQEFQALRNMVDILAVVRKTIDKALANYPNVVYELRGDINENGLCDVLVVYQVPDETPIRLEITL